MYTCEVVLWSDSCDRW